MEKKEKKVQKKRLKRGVKKAYNKLGGFSKSKLKSIVTVEGETIEMKVRRITKDKEPIKDGAPIIHTERKDGVQPGFNVRTDRFEVAADAMDAIQKSKIAKRDGGGSKPVIKLEPKEDPKDEGGGKESEA